MDDKDDKAEGSMRRGGGGAGLERAAFSLLREIVDLAADERDLHLAGHDPEVVARVRAILDADGDPTEPLAGGLPFPPAALGVDDGGSRPEADGLGRIGPYRLLAALGEGGMGRVYLAEQGEPVERRVALKVIGSRFLDDHTRLRFQAERQALARLSHPHIAQLYEAGSTADGRPYFAMEVIDGPPITVYCDRHRLPVERRLELFVAVCRGVQHAHQRQLLHRDLKPTNVLVAETDGEPVPKVIDFGIAKALIWNDRCQAPFCWKGRDGVGWWSDEFDLEPREDGCSGSLRRRVTLIFAGYGGEPPQSRMTVLRREGPLSRVASPGEVSLSHSAAADPPLRAC